MTITPPQNVAANVEETISLLQGMMVQISGVRIVLRRWIVVISFGTGLSRFGSV
jgi:hypothetical protein